MDFEKADVSPVEDWIETAPDVHHFLQSDVEQTQKVIFGREEDLKETFCPDPAIVTKVGEVAEFIGRHLTIIASLADHYYLARTSVTKFNNIFVILDDRAIGKVILKFYWDMKFYWTNFGYGRPGGCLPSGIYARYNCTVSNQGAYVLIVGPTEACTNRRKSLPAAKLLYCHTWEVKDFQVDPLEWPAQVLFDPRPSQEHIVYLVQSTQPSFTLMYRPMHGTLHRYSLRDRKSLVQLGMVITGFVQTLQRGKQLLVIQPIQNNDCRGMIQALCIIDSMTFDPILKITNDLPNGPLEQVSLFSQMKAFYSADYRNISIVLWERMYKEECIVSNVLTLTPSKLCLPLMTLKEICRSVILRYLKVKDLPHITIPVPLKSFLKGMD